LPFIYGSEKNPEARSLNPVWRRLLWARILTWIGARLVRILLDFAGICRAKSLTLFAFITAWVTHNP
jgi:hypothetical protein